MPIKLKPALEETFVLERTDKAFGDEGAETTVKIKQASQGEHDERAALWARFDKHFNLLEDEMIISQRVSPAEVRRTEVFLTLIACDIQDADGKPLFTFPLEKTKFIAAWSQLPGLVAEEIHEKVLAVNVMWSGASGEAL